MSLSLTACVTRVVQLNARHNAQQAVREADRLMRQGQEDSARVLYAQAAAAASMVLASETLSPEDRVRWRSLGGRAAAFSAQCTDASALLRDALRSARIPVLEELDARIALADCLLREGHAAEGREQLRSFAIARLDALSGDAAQEARQRLDLWTMRLLLHENDEPAVDAMLSAFGPPPRGWEPHAALYATVQRERSVSPLLRAVREARDAAAALEAIGDLDTATIRSTRLMRLREGTDRLQLLLATNDPSGAAAYHAGDVALEMIGNPMVAVEIWCDASRRHHDSPLAPLLLWRAATAPIAQATSARDSLLARFPHSPEAARLRGDSLAVDPQAEREREELLRSRWVLMERNLAERRAAARTPDGR